MVNKLLYKSLKPCNMNLSTILDAEPLLEVPDSVVCSLNSVPLYHGYLRDDMIILDVDNKTAEKIGFASLLELEKHLGIGKLEDQTVVVRSKVRKDGGEIFFGKHIYLKLPLGVSKESIGSKVCLNGTFLDCLEIKKDYGIVPNSLYDTSKDKMLIPKNVNDRTGSYIVFLKNGQPLPTEILTIPESFLRLILKSSFKDEVSSIGFKERERFIQENYKMYFSSDFDRASEYVKWLNQVEMYLIGAFLEKNDFFDRETLIEEITTLFSSKPDISGVMRNHEDIREGVSKIFTPFERKFEERSESYFNSVVQCESSLKRIKDRSIEILDDDNQSSLSTLRKVLEIAGYPLKIKLDNYFQTIIQAYNDFSRAQKIDGKSAKATLDNIFINYFVESFLAIINDKVLSLCFTKEVEIGDKVTVNLYALTTQRCWELVTSIVDNKDAKFFSASVLSNVYHNGVPLFKENDLARFLDYIVNSHKYTLFLKILGQQISNNISFKRILSNPTTEDNFIFSNLIVQDSSQNDINNISNGDLACKITPDQFKVKSVKPSHYFNYKLDILTLSSELSHVQDDVFSDMKLMFLKSNIGEPKILTREEVAKKTEQKFISLMSSIGRSVLAYKTEAEPSFIVLTGKTEINNGGNGKSTFIKILNSVFEKKKGIGSSIDIIDNRSGALADADKYTFAALTNCRLLISDDEKGQNTANGLDISSYIKTVGRQGVNIRAMNKLSESGETNYDMLLIANNINFSAIKNEESYIRRLQISLFENGSTPLICPNRVNDLSHWIIFGEGSKDAPKLTEEEKSSMNEAEIYKWDSYIEFFSKEENREIMRSLRLKNYVAYGDKFSGRAGDWAFNPFKLYVAVLITKYNCSNDSLFRKWDVARSKFFVTLLNLGKEANKAGIPKNGFAKLEEVIHTNTSEFSVHSVVDKAISINPFKKEDTTYYVASIEEKGLENILSRLFSLSKEDSSPKGQVKSESELAFLRISSILKGMERDSRGRVKISSILPEDIIKIHCDRFSGGRLNEKTKLAKPNSIRILDLFDKKNYNELTLKNITPLLEEIFFLPSGSLMKGSEVNFAELKRISIFENCSKGDLMPSIFKEASFDSRVDERIWGRIDYDKKVFV